MKNRIFQLVDYKILSDHQSQEQKWLMIDHNRSSVATLVVYTGGKSQMTVLYGH